MGSRYLKKGRRGALLLWPARGREGGPSFISRTVEKASRDSRGTQLRDYSKQLGSYGLDGLRLGVDEEGLLGVPLSSLGYWTMHHKLERAPTFCELFDQTHKRKGTDDYVSESARRIVETYDKMMADRYVQDTPQPILDPEAWVDVEGGARKSQVYDFGDNLDSNPVLSSYASSITPWIYASSSVATPRSDGEDIRTLIWEVLS
ncbi:hypothetical protein Taro_020949 [Colocasia esculenta]|uniref:Uncharacterized protein n=1 Tax=Colocasia esculenta TaxID=4460 RepID=A0A843UXN8_COLES|nr:hypothetical protein [Colocasia esculenta]